MGNQRIRRSAFAQTQPEAPGLQRQPERGTSASAGQNGLDALQAEADGFWARRLTRAVRLGHNLARISAPGQPGLPAVQRWPAIEDEGKTLAKPSREEIAAFLTKHGAKASILFESVLKGITGSFSGAEGARRLAKAVHDGQAGLIGTTQRGQKSIMNKLGAIANLVVTARGGLEKQKQEAIGLCSSLENDQGLCFGFTEIFKRHARWEAALWDAIARWVPAPGTPEEMLNALDRHLDETIHWASGRREERANEALLLLKEAWEFMQQQGTGGYLDLPDWLQEVEGTPSETKLVKTGQITGLVKVPQVEGRGTLQQRAKEEVNKKDAERKAALGGELARTIEQASAWLAGLDGLFELPTKAEEKIRAAAPGEFAAGAVNHYKILARGGKQEPATRLETFRARVTAMIKGKIVDTAFEARFAQQKLAEAEELAETLEAEQLLAYERARDTFGVWLAKAGSAIDDARGESSRGEVLVEISTAGHSMAARRTAGHIDFLEPQYLGAGTFDSWAGLLRPLWEGLQVGAGPDEFENGIALDLELSDVQAIGAEELDPKEKVNRLEGLEAESIAAFSDLASTDSPAKFLQENNPALFAKIRFTDR